MDFVLFLLHGSNTHFCRERGYVAFLGLFYSDLTQTYEIRLRYLDQKTAVGASDLCRGHLSMPDVALLVVDECHHTVGNHAYAKIMEQHYHRVAERT